MYILIIFVFVIYFQQLLCTIYYNYGSVLYFFTSPVYICYGSVRYRCYTVPYGQIILSPSAFPHAVYRSPFHIDYHYNTHTSIVVHAFNTHMIFPLLLNCYLVSCYLTPLHKYVLKPYFHIYTFLVYSDKRSPSTNGQLLCVFSQEKIICHQTYCP